MSTELLTEPEILALLEKAFPADENGEWISAARNGRKRFTGVVAGTYTSCEALTPRGWIFERAFVRGYGGEIPAAIADFRAKVAAEATALGAVKANPTSDYNNVEAAIYAAAFVAQLPKWESARDAARVAAACVEYYRATIK